MSGHGANPIFFNKKNTSRTLANPDPPMSGNIPFLPIGLIWLVFCIEFVLQVNLIKINIYVQNQNTEAHWEPSQTSKMELFANIVISWKSLAIFAKSSILHNWNASGISKVTLCKYAREGKHICKNVKQILILQERRRLL